MSTETDQDETSGFEVESEDFPQEQESPQEEASEDQARSEEVKSEGDEEVAKETDDSISEDAPKEEVKHEKPNGFQKRINKEVRRSADLKRENESQAKRIKELEGKRSESEVKAPVEAAFETYDQYLDALDKYDSTAETKEPAKDSESDKQKDTNTGNTLTDNQKSAMEVIKENIDNDEGKPSDFEAVALDPKVPITGDMLEALAECDNMTDVMMQLGNDHALAKSIADKSPVQQMREIAKLDLTVKVTPPKPIKTTNAPDPISTVKGSEQQTKSDDEMSFSEFEAADRERNSKRKSTW